MKALLEKINFILLICLIILAGLSIYLNFTGYANSKIIIDQINKDFLYEIPSDNELKEGQLKGLVESLGDPYASYIPKDKIEDFNNSINQRYQGIGVSFNFKDPSKITVNKVFKNSPAEKAGVKVNDVLTEIENNKVDNKIQEEIISLIRGEEGTFVNLTFERVDNGQIVNQNFKIERGKVDVDLVEIKAIDNLAVATIRSFGDNISEEFNNEIRNIIKDDKIDTIVINLLDNSGGKLDQATNIISTFVPKNTLILKEKTKNGIIEFKSNDTGIDLSKYSVKIMINENSASASEILAASIKELKNDTLIYGRKSFGKGVVQKVVNLPNGALLKYTFAEWLTPNGKSIDKIGVNVDKEYPNSVESLEDRIISDILVSTK